MPTKMYDTISMHEDLLYGTNTVIIAIIKEHAGMKSSLLTSKWRNTREGIGKSLNQLKEFITSLKRRFPLVVLH